METRKQGMLRQLRSRTRPLISHLRRSRSGDKQRPLQETSSSPDLSAAGLHPPDPVPRDRERRRPGAGEGRREEEEDEEDEEGQLQVENRGAGDGGPPLREEGPGDVGLAQWPLGQSDEDHLMSQQDVEGQPSDVSAGSARSCSTSYLLTVNLKEGHNLVIRDRS
ncbi:hypothetical protein CRUP_016759, partial [Coryphaenoides rupestris]